MAKKAKPVNLDFMTASPQHSVLSSMFSESVTDKLATQPIEISRLEDNPYQPRLTIDQESLKELAQVIKAQGFQGVLVARPHPDKPDFYQLTAGHRRRQAAATAGLSTIPTVVQELSNEEMAAIAITENIQREDLTPLEEGNIFLLMSEEMGYTHEQIAREIGKNRGYVENRLRVARAPVDIQELVRVKPDSLRSVSALIKVKNEVQRTEAITQLLQGKLTADDLPGFLAEKPAIASTVVDNQINSVKKPRQRKSTNLPEGDDETARARIGNSKLVTILRSLHSFKDSIKQRDLSVDERNNLTEIASIIEDLQKSWL